MCNNAWTTILSPATWIYTLYITTKTNDPPSRIPHKKSRDSIYRVSYKYCQRNRFLVLSYRIQIYPFFFFSAVSTINISHLNDTTTSLEVVEYSNLISECGTKMKGILRPRLSFKPTQPKRRLKRNAVKRQIVNSFTDFPFPNPWQTLIVILNIRRLISIMNIWQWKVPYWTNDM